MQEASSCWDAVLLLLGMWMEATVVASAHSMYLQNCNRDNGSSKQLKRWR
jgi:hypothetical protein